jgi:hypothetical protein
MIHNVRDEGVAGSNPAAPTNFSKFPADKQLLRRTCGCALANKGHDTRALQAYLGHRSVKHRVAYIRNCPRRDLRTFWRAWGCMRVSHG